MTLAPLPATENGDATDDNRPTLSGIAEPCSTISTPIMAFLYRPFRPLPPTPTANGALPPRWHSADMTMSLSALPRPTIAATSGQSVSLILISTRSHRCWKATGGRRRRQTSSAPRKLAVPAVIKDSREIRSVVERQATTAIFSIGTGPAKLTAKHYISVTDKAANMVR